MKNAINTSNNLVNARRRSTLKGMDVSNIFIQQLETVSPNMKDPNPSMFKPMKNIIEHVHEEEEED